MHAMEFFFDNILNKFREYSYLWKAFATDLPKEEKFD